MYSLNLYRLTNIYVRAAVGEYSAMLFFPIILYGLWYIFTEKAENLRESRIWFILASGYLGVLFTHIISCEMVGMFTILILILEARRIFCREVLSNLIKSFMTVLLGGLWFCIPLLDYMIDGCTSGAINNFIPGYQESRGLFWGQFFLTRYSITGEENGIRRGIAGEMPLTLGTSFLLVIVAAAFVSLCYYHMIVCKREWLVCILLLVMAMWVCTKDFPFTWFAEKVDFLKPMISSLQFPWRFLTMVSLFSTWLFVMIFFKAGIDKDKSRIVSVMAALIILMDSLNFMSEVENNFPPLDAGISLSSFDIGAGEYLFPDANLDDYVDEITRQSSCIIVKYEKKQNNKIIIDVKNLSELEEELELPLINYKGYGAEDIETGERFELSNGISHRIRIRLPPGYEGEVIIEFKEPWYWRGAEVISLISVIFIVFWKGVGRRTNVKAELGRF